MTGVRPRPCQACPSDITALPDTLSSWLLNRELHPGKRLCTAKRASDLFASRHLDLVAERELPYPKVSQFDKAFTATWIGDELIAIGTKCNKLVVLNVNTHAIKVVNVPPNPHRLMDTQEEHCGMHAVSVNHSRDMIAAGGHDPRDCVILSLPTFKPVQTLMAHTDWLFGLAWVTDRHIATGSRDKTISLWKVQPGSSCYNTVPLKVSHDHKGKVRDLKFSLTVDRLSSLSSDGTMKLWDSSLNLIQSYKLPCEEELVALAMDDHLLAAGSKNFISLVDCRSGKSMVDVQLRAYDPYGVRSLSFNRNTISCGGASGHIFFYDVRAARFIPCTGEKAFLETGDGWIDETTRMYRGLFSHGARLKQACYAHCWDVYGHKFFACGGPLAVGLRGCYMAMWQ